MTDHATPRLKLKALPPPLHSSALRINIFPVHCISIITTTYLVATCALIYTVLTRKCSNYCRLISKPRVDVKRLSKCIPVVATIQCARIQHFDVPHHSQTYSTYKTRLRDNAAYFYYTIKMVLMSMNLITGYHYLFYCADQLNLKLLR